MKDALSQPSHAQVVTSAAGLILAILGGSAGREEAAFESADAHPDTGGPCAQPAGRTCFYLTMLSNRCTLGSKAANDSVRLPMTLPRRSHLIEIQPPV